MTALELNRIHQRLIDSAVHEAMTLESKGSLLAAAKAWQKACRHAARFAAECEPSERKNAASNSAELYAARALELRSYLRNIESDKIDHTEHARDDFRAKIRGMIYRTDVTMESVAGLELALRNLQSFFAIHFAAMPPGVISPPIGNILFYGLPGTGKTLLAAALSNLVGATFFVVKCRDLLGENASESVELVQSLYEEARTHPLSIIFIDDFHFLAANSFAMAHSPNQRALQCLLTELDQVQHNEKIEDRGRVVTVAATNTPWLLDEAVLSRFKRRIYTQLPDFNARKQMLYIYLSKRGFGFEGTSDAFATICDGLSGREVEQVISDAISKMLLRANPELQALRLTNNGVFSGDQLRVALVSLSDVEQARREIHPVGAGDLVEKFQQWQAI
ncbi:MAG: ATP-binding protein [Planctomycetaceae bacterium]|nr:ATP-binding protein [Planctomycetaceae bacterium]